MDDEDELLTARKMTPTDDALASVCRWGGLLAGLGLLAYAALLA